MSKRILGFSLICFFVDIVSKIFVNNVISLNKSVEVIKSFFYLTNVHNSGAAWSILDGKRFLLIVIGGLGLYVVSRLWKSFKSNFRNDLAISLLYGGICGNLFDRVVYGFVRDFLDFNIFGYNFPVFNLADSFIFIGVCLLVYASFKGEDLSGSSSRKGRKIR